MPRRLGFDQRRRVAADLGLPGRERQPEVAHDSRVLGPWPDWERHIHAGDAYVLLAGNGSSNMALDTNGNFSNGALPSLQTGIDPNKDDKFLIVPGSAPGTWTFKTQWNSGMCLDNPGSQSADGTGIQLWSCNGGTNQNWIISNRSKRRSRDQESAVGQVPHQPGSEWGWGTVRRLSSQTAMATTITRSGSSRLTSPGQVGIRKTIVVAGSESWVGVE